MKFLVLLLIVMPLFSMSQSNQHPYPYPHNYYSIIAVRIKPQTTFNFGSISYEITDIVDLQNNYSILGDVYMGALNHRIQQTVKKGLPHNFTRYFDKALKYTKTGDRKIVVAFRKLSVSEKEENLGLHGGRLRTYEIEVEYYESLDSNLIYLYTDHQKVDSLSRSLEYNVNKFCFQFFKVSLAQLDVYLNESQNSKNKIALVDNLNTQDVEGKSIAINAHSKKLDENYLKTKFIHPPKGHYIYNFQKFYGTFSNGFKFGLFGYIRAWDSFECAAVIAGEFGYFELEKNRIDDNRIEAIDYAYLSLGIGTLKPLNNFFLAELTGKLAIGKESIHKYSKAKQNNTNTLLGIQLQQKIHFMLGKGFGLTMNLGTYENFFPTTQYMNTDFGISFGFGFKI